MNPSTKQKWPQTAVWLAAVLFVAGPSLAADDAAAAPDEKMWRVEVDALYFGAMGADRTTGAVAVRDESSTPIVESYEPFRLKIDGDQTGRLEVTRFNRKWGWGLNGWFYDGGDSDTRIGPLNSDSTNGITTTLYTESLVPSLVAPDAGTGRLDYGGTTHMSAGAVSLYGAREAGKAIELRIGLRFAYMREERDENESLVENGDAFGLGFDGQVETRLLVGPTVGLRGQGRVGNNLFEGWADLAVVFGDAEHDVTTTLREPGQTSIVSIMATRERTVIPTIELGIRWKYVIKRRWGIGLSVFSSIWLDAPTAAQPAIPEITDPATPARGAVFQDDTFTASGFGITGSFTDHPR